ncbi:MAG: aldo/keto reductase [Actinomycetota bacterium]|nr:aldo/keto reductase [Actinomycetota bacterium]MDP2288842.1 aldo/keto reductase [Actinomycetota bacterium]
MKYTHLGHTGLTVSKLCLGTMNFGPETNEADSFAIMDHAHSVGINFFDTANGYGGPGHMGRTETILGNWFASGGGRREKTVIATKLYASFSDWPNDGKLSALNIRRACDASLKRMQTDYIDIYQMHHVDRRTPWDEIWEAMEVLRNQGKIIYVGSSNFAGWHIAQAQEAARRRNFLGLASEQSIYNLLERTVELEVLPASQFYGLGVIPWSPLQGGLLGGIIKKLESGDVGRSKVQRTNDRLEALRPQIQAWEDFCAKRDEDPADTALAWLLHNPAVTAPIIGPRTLAQLDGSLRALDITLDSDAMKELDVLFPGPGGTAPEAYAW